MKKIYQGNYFDFDKDGNEIPFGFRMEVELDEKWNFHGIVWEDEFSGITEKHLTVKGFIDEDHISFVKQYPCAYEFDHEGNSIVDESRRGHSVIYDGYLDEESGIWTGEWEIEGETQLLPLGGIETEIFLGRFEMHTLEP